MSIREASQRERQDAVLICLLEAHPKGLTRTQIKERTWLSSKDLNAATYNVMTESAVIKDRGRFRLTEAGQKRAEKAMRKES